jgi:hypothetical protein
MEAHLTWAQGRVLFRLMVALPEKKGGAFDTEKRHIVFPAKAQHKALVCDNERRQYALKICIKS